MTQTKLGGTVGVRLGGTHIQTRLKVHTHILTIKAPPVFHLTQLTIFTLHFCHILKFPLRDATILTHKKMLQTYSS